MGGEGADRLYGGLDNDTLNGEIGNDELYGEDGTDTLNGGDGNDILNGGAGKDTLNGGAGSDLYVFNEGFGSASGADVISEAVSAEDTNRIFLDLDTSPAETTYWMEGYDLYFQAGSDSNNVIKITGTGTTTKGSDVLGRIGEVEFRNGTVWNLAEDLVFHDNTSSNFNGTNLADTIYGFSNNSSTYTVYAGEGDDTVYGGTNISSYSIRGGEGNDIIHGGENVSASPYSYSLYGDEGNDILLTSSGNWTLSGGSGDDTYIIGSDIKFVSIREDIDGGFDTLQFTAGILPTDLYMFADDGRFYLQFKNDNDKYIFFQRDGYSNYETNIGQIFERVVFADGTIWDLTGGLTLTGTPGNEYILTGTSFDDVIDGNGGTDTISGGGGNDILEGNNTATLTYEGAPSGVFVNLSSQNQSYEGTGVNAHRARDGSGSVDTILDFYKVIGSIHDDVIWGNEGRNTLTGGLGNDVLFGGGENDNLQGGAGDDALEGEEGNDTLNGGEGYDVLVGGAGNDILDGGAGNDVLDGGEGTGDQVRYIGGLGGAVINLSNLSKSYSSGSIAAHTAYDTWGGTDTLYNLEEVLGSAWDDLMWGGAENNELRGEAGNDVIYGGGGADRIIAGVGNDTLIGEEGNDTLRGDQGDDIYLIKQNDGLDIIDENLNEGFDTVLLASGILPSHIYMWSPTGNASYAGDLYIQIGEGNSNQVRINGGKTASGASNAGLYVEQIAFDNGNGILDAGDQIIDLTGGWNLNDTNDAHTIGGTDFNDVLSGNGGNDSLYGYNGNDTLNGGTGADTLDGGVGNDLLQGGTGNDVYVTSAGNDIIQETSGYNDAIRMAAGVTLAELSFSQSADDLIISITGGGQITIQDYYSNPHNRVETILFSDGSQAIIAEQAGTASIVYGEEGSEIINGTYLDDEIHGFGGDDTLNGGIGNDILDGGAGNDYLTDTSGDETYIYSSGDDVIYDTVGNDTIMFSEGVVISDLSFTRNGNDAIISVISGGTITLRNQFSGANIETLEFYDGTTVSLASVQYVLSGTEGNDTLTGTPHNDIITGKAGYDYMTGNGGDDIYIFSPGFGAHDTSSPGSYDRIIEQIGGGNDVISFIDGITSNDVYSWVDADEDLYLQLKSNPDDIIRIDGSGTKTDVGQRVETITFDDGVVWHLDQGLILNDNNESHKIYGSALDDTIYGNGGDDYLYAMGGNNILDGGEGNDWLSGDGGNDILIGGAGKDTLVGGGGNDVYIFAPGFGSPDSLATGMWDYINEATNSGNDTISFVGGITSDDIYSWVDINRDLYLQLKSSPNDIIRVEGSGGIGQRMENITFDDGTSWNLTQGLFLNDNEDNHSIYGTTFGDAILGNGGDDTLYGYEGNDILNGGTGNDILDGGAGSDVIDGGDGVDRLVISSSAGGGVWVDLMLGVADDNGMDQGGPGWTATDTLINIENISSSSGTDYLRGNDGANVIDSGSGNDTLIGEGGDDVLYGGNGVDILNGGAGNDILDGGTGNDTAVYSGNIADYLISHNGISYSIIDQRMGINDGSDTLLNVERFQFADGIVLASQFSNTIPIAQNDSFTGDQDMQITGNVLVNNGNGPDSDADGDTLSITPGTYTTLQGGSVTLSSNGDFVYTPTLGFLGQDEFTYTLLDGRGASDTGFVSLTVEESSSNIITGTSGNDTLYGTSSADQIYGLEGNDELYGNAGDDVLYGGDGDDYLIGGDGNGGAYGTGDGNDTLIGGAGNDYLYGEGGDNIYDGGTGNNTIFGGAGNDTYRYSGGNDVISEYGGNDIIEFAEGIAANDLSFHKIPNTTGVLIEVSNSGTILINDYFSDDNQKIETIRFFDGSTLSLSAIDFVLSGTDQNDYLYGTQEKDVIEGHEGDDVIYGYAGDDILNGGAGNDTIWGDDGNDTLNGGLGDNYLVDFSGNDTYEYSGGNDTIDDYAGIDVIKMPAGIMENDLLFTRQGNNAVISISGAGNVIINNYFDSESQRIETVELFDESVIDLSAQNFISVISGTPDDDVLFGSSSNDLMDGLSGNDILFGGDGNDTLIGGAGNDQLYGGGGNNIIDAGEGVDTIYFEGGNDIATGGTGSDTYSFFSETGSLEITDFDVAEDILDFSALMSISSIDDLQIFQDATNLIITPVDQNISVTIILASLNDINESSFRFASPFQANNEDVLVYADQTSNIDVLANDIGSSLSLSQIIDGPYFGSVVINPDNTISYTPRTGFTGFDLVGYEIMDNNGNTSVAYAQISIGTPGSQMLISYEPDALLTGGEGNDFIYDYAFAEGSTTHLSGLGGNDYLYGVITNGTYDGGDGVDLIEFTTLYGGVAINLALGTAQEIGQSIIATLTGFENAVGSWGQDILTGSAGDNILMGGQGSDVIDGGAGNDTIDYRNYFIYNLGSVVVDLEAGTAYEATDGSTDTLISIENVVGSIYDDSIKGNSSNNRLDGAEGNDTVIYSGNYTDYLITDLGNGEYELSDLRSGENDGTDTVSGFEQFQFADGTISVNNLINTAPVAQDDVFTGDQDTDIVGNLLADNGNGADSDDNNDILSVISGTYTTLQGGSVTLYTNGDFVYTPISGFIGQDEFTYTLLDGRGGSDTAVVSLTVEEASVNIITGTTGNDTLYGTEAIDQIDGLAGNDTIFGYGGNDVLIGTSGNDILYGGDGDDTYIVGPNMGQVTIQESTNGGFDTIHFGTGVLPSDLRIWAQWISNGPLIGNSLFIQIGNDTSKRIRIPVTNSDYESNIGQIVEQVTFEDDPGTVWTLTDGLTMVATSASDQRITGTPYDDTIYGNGGTDHISGGRGNDTIIVSGINNSLFYLGAPGDVLVNVSGQSRTSQNGITVEHNQAIDGHGGTDTLIGQFEALRGGEYNDSIWGNNSTSIADNLYGNGGNDELYGLAGNDFLFAGNGDDILDGGAGNDTLNGGNGIDTVSYATATSGVTVNLSLTTAQNTGGAGSDTISLVENITGSNYNDTLTGNTGSNTLHGGGGHDTLMGGNGNDVLYGDIGNDVLYGQGGSDTFAFHAGDVGSWSDTVADFNLFEGDILDIADILDSFDPLMHLITDYVEITDDGFNSYLKVDVDGGADNFVQIAQLNNVTGLTDEEALYNNGTLIV